MPPLWWNDLGQWPPVIRYLPDAPVIYSLLELGKQEGQSLRTTAELLDELTEGVAIASTKPLSSNDWFDSSHAAAALPYCDVFLTEKNLAHKLPQMLKADLQYGCQVIGSFEEAMARFTGS